MGKVHCQEWHGRIRKRCRFLQFRSHFCDESRVAKTQYLQSESIYVLVKVTNSSDLKVAVRAGRGSGFNRFAIRMTIDGITAGRLTPARCGDVVVFPRENYTFLRRFTTPTRSDGCAYVTPTPGRYQARLVYKNQDLPITSPFSVVSGSPPSLTGEREVLE